MTNARRNINDAPINAYEQQRIAIIAENKRKLASLNIPTLKTAGPSEKRTKRTHDTSVVATEGHNLRARPQRNYNGNENIQIAEDLVINQSDGDFLCDNEADFEDIPKKRAGKGRGITRLDDIFARKSDMPKIKITLNEHGQPVGKDCRKFSSAIGCLVRKKLSVACADWRLVPAEKKYEVWTSIKEIYDIDAAAFNWFLASAGRKWKEFKATLKEQYFNEKLTNEELKTKVGDRVDDDAWNFLTEYWMSPNFDARTEIAKVNRSKLEQHHTSGSKSFACSGHEMEKKLGRPPRRDELYIKTHTRKNGVPLGPAEPIINKLKAIVEARPELKERSIQQGDAFAAVCGEKEPRGRVRVLGLGPTPQEVGTPGLKCYTPTRLQMEVFARKKLESEKAALEKRIADMQEEMMERERQNVEMGSHNDSNSRLHSQSPREEHIHQAHDAQFQEDDASLDNHCEEDEYVFLPRGGNIRPTSVTTTRPRIVSATRFSHDALVGEDGAQTSVPPNECNPIQPKRATTSVWPRNDAATRFSHDVRPRNDAATRFSHDVQLRNDTATHFSHDALVGEDVILYAMLRSDPVAKGTITSTNPNTVLGGENLGTQFCEVVVNVVLKRDADLPRPYDHMETMGDAYMMPVAWPYKRMKVSKASKSSHVATGNSGIC
eukprot:XP_020404245.1 uncharacterized protein LOC103649371 isoform X1 [Zea mays]